MAITNEKPSRRIGSMLYALFDEVLEKPELNTEAYLTEHTLELSVLPEDELHARGEKGKMLREEKEDEEVEEIRKKYNVK